MDEGRNGSGALAPRRRRPREEESEDNEARSGEEEGAADVLRRLRREEVAGDEGTRSRKVTLPGSFVAFAKTIKVCRRNRQRRG